MSQIPSSIPPNQPVSSSQPLNTTWGIFAKLQPVQDFFKGLVTRFGSVFSGNGNPKELQLKNPPSLAQANSNLAGTSQAVALVATATLGGTATAVAGQQLSPVPASATATCVVSVSPLAEKKQIIDRPNKDGRAGYITFENGTIEEIKDLARKNASSYFYGLREVTIHWKMGGEYETERSMLATPRHAYVFFNKCGSTEGDTKLAETDYQVGQGTILKKKIEFAVDLDSKETCIHISMHIDQRNLPSTYNEAYITKKLQGILGVIGLREYFFYLSKKRKLKLAMVTEYGNRGNLLDYLSMYREELSDEQRDSFAMQIASTIKDIHARGVVGIDLKLDNIVIVQEKEKGPLLLKFIDFSEASTTQPVNAIEELPTIVDSFPGDQSNEIPLNETQKADILKHLNDKGNRLITRQYAAPEVLESWSSGKNKKDVVVPVIDVWSMGVMFLKLYAPLYNEGSFNLLIDKMCQLSKFSEERIQAEIASLVDVFFGQGYHRPEIVQLIKQMLCINPGKRLSSDQVWQKIVIIAGKQKSQVMPSASALASA